MADFIDNEASEASSSDEDAIGDGRRRDDRKRAEIEDSSEEEDEDDEEAEAEMADLINDEDEEEEDDDESSSEEAAGRKRSHGSEDESSSLEEEDLDLIQENLGVRINKKKKYKRIRKVADDDSDSDTEKKEDKDDGERIREQLFGRDDNLLDSDDENVQKTRSRPVDDDLDLDVDNDEESDSEADFIVDDNDQPVNRRPKKRGGHNSDSAMQQAQEIFGVDFDYDDLDEDADDYSQDGGYEEDEYEDDQTGEPRVRPKRSGRKTIYDIYEPAELEKSHLTEFDQEIRVKDEPERYQLRSIPVTQASDEEIAEEADWIFRNAFDRPTISIQEANREPIAGRHFETVKGEIEYALKCIRNEKLEVPFIAAYRREYVATLAPVPDDKRDIDDARSYRDLWTIYNQDEQWCSLQISKKSVENLYIAMRAYLKTKISDSRIRDIRDSDLERIHKAKDAHEVQDCRLFFQLHYQQLITEMKLYTLEKKIEDKRANRTEPETEADAEGEGEGEGEAEAEPEPEREPDAEQDESEEKLYKRLSKFKISSSRDSYQMARQEFIGDFVKNFGLTPEQFGENLCEDYQKNNVFQHGTSPKEMAANHIRSNGRFKTVSDVIEAAKLMYAREISCDPLVRRTFRKHYFENAVLNVKPTTQGLQEIDENHPCYTFKYLKNKPVSMLTCEQFLHLTNAEKAKLLEIRFSLEPQTDVKGHMSPYYESLKALFYSDFSSMVTKEWNELRDDSIKIALYKYILPCLEKQLRQKLVQEAQAKIIKTSREKLFDWLNVAGWSPEDERFEAHEEFALRDGVRICGFTFNPEGEEPCFAAIIDQEGELKDHIRLPYLNIRKKMERLSSLEKQNHAKDRIKFKQFIINKKPHAVALAANTIQTKYICSHLAQILDELHAHDGLPLIPIQIVNNELSSIYMRTKRASEEFPEFPPLLLQAVSLARKLNDPLSEYAKLCTPDNDILCLHFHSLEADLPKQDFAEQLYQEFVTRTNAVGVDPNQVIAHPHMTSVVQFIAGLGPRKGANLLRSIKRSSTSSQLVSRQQLVKELGMTATIYINCSGFIKLDTERLGDEFPDEHVSRFDSTRIHPESYSFARKIAVDALNETEEEDGIDTSEEAAAAAISEVFEHPEKLDDLELVAFAQHLEMTGKGKKAYTLHMIKSEFQSPYKDTRKPYGQGPTPEEVFAMLTKETPQTFYIGKLVTCKVVAIPRKRPTPAQLDVANPVKNDATNLWRCPFCMKDNFPDLSVVWHHFDNNECEGYAIGIRCILDNGLFGLVPTKFISDKEVSDPSHRVKIGQTIHARVIKIDAEKFGCDLTCRTSDLIDEAGRLKPVKDDYYDFDLEKQITLEQSKKTERTKKRPHCKRIIVHPAFENIACKPCERKLAESEQGRAIIRPSSLGPDRLTVSWKVADGIYSHVTVVEDGKTNSYSLGQQLFIDNEPYEDLDEIIARYIEPMASYAREILSHKYCIQRPPGEAQDEFTFMQNSLAAAKETQSTLPYLFCPSHNLPGKFLLGYMPNDKAKIEYLTVTPRGLRFRGGYFRNLSVLIKWFKMNWRNIQPLHMSIHGSVPMSQ